MKKVDVIVIAIAILTGIIIYSALDYKKECKKLEFEKELKNIEIKGRLMDANPSVLEIGEDRIVFIKEFNYINDEYNVTYSFFKYKDGKLVRLK